MVDETVVNLKGEPLVLQELNQPDAAELMKNVLRSLERLKKLALKDVRQLRDMRFNSDAGATCGYAYWSARVKGLMHTLDSGVKL